MAIFNSYFNITRGYYQYDEQFISARSKQLGDSSETAPPRPVSRNLVAVLRETPWLEQWLFIVNHPIR